MPYRKIIFTEYNVYHIINRGVAHAPIFINLRDYLRFIELIEYYQYAPDLKFSIYKTLSTERRHDYFYTWKKENEPLVEIHAFALMPNHFHLLLKNTQKKWPAIIYAFTTKQLCKIF